LGRRAVSRVVLVSRDRGEKMSYWIYLEDEDGPVEVERHAEGGTYAIGGVDCAEVNVTYNYARHFDFRALNQKQAKETLPILEVAVHELGTERSDDYWEPTPGNAGAAVALLRDWARQRPDAVWDVH
jgi:hypothetical protein